MAPIIALECFETFQHHYLIFVYAPLDLTLTKLPEYSPQLVENVLYLRIDRTKVTVKCSRDLQQIE